MTAPSSARDRLMKRESGKSSDITDIAKDLAGADSSKLSREPWQRKKDAK